MLLVSERTSRLPACFTVLLFYSHFLAIITPYFSISPPSLIAARAVRPHYTLLSVYLTDMIKSDVNKARALKAKAKHYQGQGHSPKAKAKAIPVGNEAGTES